MISVACCGCRGRRSVVLAATAMVCVTLQSSLVCQAHGSEGATDVSTSPNDTSRAAFPSRQPRPSDQTWANDRLDKAILIYALAGLCLLASVGLLCKYVVCGHRVTALTRSPGSGVTSARSRSRVDSEVAADSSMVLVFSNDITRDR